VWGCVCVPVCIYVYVCVAVQSLFIVFGITSKVNLA